MGKASSAKKVARAARSGGKTKGQRKNLGFPIAVVALVLLGVGLVAFARSDQDSGGSPALGDHWHAAFGVYVCDRWVADLSDRGPDQLGIHTHEDGLVHIHPFLAGAAGSSATLGRFFDQVGMRVTDSSITLPEGGQFAARKYVSGETTCGGEEAQVQVAFWESALETDGPPTEVRTSGIAGTHLDADLSAYTLAFLPEGAEIPPPPAAAEILEKAVVDGGINQPIQGVPEQNELPPEATAPAGEEGTEPGSDTSDPPVTDAPPATEPPPPGDGG